MGVHGLWRLLDPFGQVTRPEDWTDRRVAIDASIWIVQFRAKVDASEDVESKVLEGFLSRILKLLFYGIEAVFVFDGTSSSLKAAEQSKRARQREAATQVFLRKRAKQIMMAQVAAGQLKVDALPMQMTSNGDDGDEDKIESDKVSKTTPRVKRGKQLPPSRAIVLLRKSATRKRERSTSLRDELHCTAKEEGKNGEEEASVQNSKTVEEVNNTEHTTNTQLTNNTHKPANYYGVTIHPHIARLAPDAVSASVVKHFLADARELQAEANKGEQMISQNVLKHTSTALFMGPREVAEGNTNNTPQSTKEHNSAHVQKLHHKTHTIEDDSPITLPEENEHYRQEEEPELTSEEEEVKVIGNDETMIVDIDDSQQPTDQIDGSTNREEEEEEEIESELLSSSSSSSVVIEVVDAKHNITSKTKLCERDADNANAIDDDDDDDDIKIVEVNCASRSPSIKEYKAESSYTNTGITTTFAHNTISSSPSVTSIEEVKPMSNLDILRAVSAEIDWHGNDENKSNKENSNQNDENENDTKEYKNEQSISFSPSPSSQEAVHDNKDGQENKKQTEEQEIDWQRQREENLWNPSTQLMRCVEAQTSVSYEQPQLQKQMEQRLEPPLLHQSEESELHKLEISRSEECEETERISKNDFCDNKVSSTITPSELSHSAPTLQHERRETEEIKEKLHLHEEEHLSPSTIAAYSEPMHDDVQRTLPHRVLPADVIDIAQLLNLCGIPYVISPSEADAQCAYLAQAHLVDAVFSEDSDVVVHGAMTVLRGFFSSSQHAVEYRHAALATIGVNKRVLVALAMLLGCDYTNGVHGIGLVGALNAITVA